MKLPSFGGYILLSLFRKLMNHPIKIYTMVFTFEKKKAHRESCFVIITGKRRKLFSTDIWNLYRELFIEDFIFTESFVADIFVFTESFVAENSIITERFIADDFVFTERMLQRIPSLPSVLLQMILSLQKVCYREFYFYREFFEEILSVQRF